MARRAIGEGSTIGPGTTIEDSTIGAGCRVWLSVVERSTVEDGVTIGPYSHLRPGSHVGAGSEIGNYAEIKNSRLGKRVKQHHTSYLGDADVGDGTNVGAGTITANWDGQRQEPDRDRSERLPRRRHDARRAGRGRRGREDRRRRRS